MDNMRNNKTILQAAIFVLLFLAILVPVSYMVRTNGDVKDRFAGFYAEKNPTRCGACWISVFRRTGESPWKRWNRWRVLSGGSRPGP